MNHFKLIAFIAIAVVGQVASAGTASATTVTSPSGTAYTGEIKATAGTIELHGSFVTVNCKNASVTVSKVESHGAGVTSKGAVTSGTASECNFPVKLLKGGSLEAHATSGGNGTITSNGAEITIETSIANCIFTTSNTDVGLLTGGTTAKLDINSASIPRTGHSVFCGGSGTWTGSYTVNTPDTLLIS
jgi:hypothetical protein